MLTITIPDKLTNRINEFANSVSQSPEEFVVELIQERLDHDSAYNETIYLAASETNRDRLNKAIKDIKSGKYETHGLLND